MARSAWAWRGEGVAGHLVGRQPLGAVPGARDVGWLVVAQAYTAVAARKWL